MSKKFGTTLLLCPALEFCQQNITFRWAWYCGKFSPDSIKQNKYWGFQASRLNYRTPHSSIEGFINHFASFIYISEVGILNQTVNKLHLRFRHDCSRLSHGSVQLHKEDHAYVFAASDKCKNKKIINRFYKYCTWLKLGKITAYNKNIPIVSMIISTISQYSRIFSDEENFLGQMCPPNDDSIRTDQRERELISTWSYIFDRIFSVFNYAILITSLPIITVLPIQQLGRWVFRFFRFGNCYTA